MAAGVPAVCSPVGINAKIAEDNKHCLLADTPEDFYQQLAKLLDNHQLREQLGNQGRKLVINQFSVQVAGKKLALALQEAWQKKSG